MKGGNDDLSESGDWGSSFEETPAKKVEVHQEVSLLDKDVPGDLFSSTGQKSPEKIKGSAETGSSSVEKDSGDSQGPKV